ncbi:MAG: hypothetical protein DHS20C04_23230 [Hyphococcus sp.]|nr:MAG: hypothetical protein DHS20C04_23230 [Marinicaulis sp.]
MLAVFHIWLIAAHQGRRKTVDKREIAHLLVAQQSLAQNRRGFLVEIGRRVDLQIVFGLVVRIGGAAVDKFCACSNLIQAAQLLCSQDIFDFDKNGGLLKRCSGTLDVNPGNSPAKNSIRHSLSGEKRQCGYER